MKSAVLVTVLLIILSVSTLKVAPFVSPFLGVPIPTKLILRPKVGQPKPISAKGATSMEVPDVPLLNIQSHFNSATSYDTVRVDMDNLEWPCSGNGLYCVRNYFVQNSRCKKVYGPVPDPFKRPPSAIYLSTANLTITEYDAEVKGLNGRILEFYINKETDKAVISVVFRRINVYCKYAEFTFHRTAKKPIITGDYMNVTYDSVIITGVIPDVKHLQLKDMEVFAYVNTSPKFIIGPGAVADSDFLVRRTFFDILANIPLNVQETLITTAPFYLATFIQYALCDFGLKLI